MSDKGDENKKKKDDKGKKDGDGKGGKQVYVRKSRRQQASSITNSILTTSQDFMSRVVAVSDDLPKSKPMAFAIILPLQPKTIHIRKPSVCLHK